MFDRNVTPLEAELGLGFYATGPPGIGGELRTVAEDFIVQEDSAPAAQARAGGKYTLARIQAKNWETNRLVRQIARQLGIPERTIYFTGTKDKRAVTIQNMAIAAPEEAVLKLSLGDVDVLETRRVDRAPKLGEHTGNAFTIRIRSFETPLDQAAEHLDRITDELLEQGGFPNFFGPQRFGSIRPITHLVGQRIVEGDLLEAVWTYIAHPSDLDPASVQEGRRTLWEERDPTRGDELLPRRFDYEHMMLDHLREHPGDAVGALEKLPRTLTSLFVSAFQSHLFNKALTERASKQHPREATSGDVLVPAAADGTPERDPFIPVTDLNAERCRTATLTGQGFTTGALPGYETPEAHGLQGEIEQSILEASGVRPDDFRILQAPWLSSRGTRRPLWCPLDAAETDAGEDEHGPYVKISFFLPKGSYATCLLREIMRTELTAY